MSDENYEPGEIGRRFAEARRRYARTWKYSFEVLKHGFLDYELRLYVNGYSIHPRDPAIAGRRYNTKFGARSNGRFWMKEATHVARQVHYEEVET